jgi:hypothetical protein
MNRTTLAAALLLASTALATLPAQADVFLDLTGIPGTGNNVVFSGIDPNNSRLILGHLNGQNNEVVRFFDVSNTTGFSGAANGQDIKIVNTRDLDITVFDSTNTIQVGTTRDIFSLKGDGNVFFRVEAVDANGVAETFNFTNNLVGYNLGPGQNGFDFSVKNGEVITDIDLFLGATGTISDFEHFRIDAAPIPTVAVPGPVVGAGLPGLAACAMFGLNFWRRRRNGASLPA